MANGDLAMLIINVCEFEHISLYLGIGGIEIVEDVNPEVSQCDCYLREVSQPCMSYL